MVNSGKGNSGLVNSGKGNSGLGNSGDYNGGNRNTGDYNSGSHNTGDYNTGNWNTGIFNTKTLKINMFNEPSDWTYKDWLDSKSIRLLRRVELPKNFNERQYKEAYTKLWKKLTKKEKEIIMTELPNFDKEIFKEITSIDVDVDED